MRFCFRAIWSGGSAVGTVIAVVGTVQWLYQLANPERIITWGISWYILVIIGLIIVLFSSLWKAYTIYRNETYRLRNESETIRHESEAKIRTLLRQSHSPKEPLSIGCGVRVERRTLADVFPEIRPSKNTRFSKSIGYLDIQNNSQEPLNIEVEYTIKGGNVPLLARDIVDNTSHVANGRVIRTLEINPRRNYHLPFVVFSMADKFHFGFRFPSWFMSKERRLGFRVEGRTSTYRLVGFGLKEKQRIELELKIIAISVLDEAKFIEIENVIFYLIECDENINEMSITQVEGQTK